MGRCVLNLSIALFKFYVGYETGTKWKLRLTLDTGKFDRHPTRPTTIVTRL